MTVAESAWLDDDEAFAAELREAVRPSRPAPRVPGCEDLVEIGRGGQGVVYAATQSATKRRVAVKVLHDLPGRSGEARRRFRRELELAASLRDPRLVQVFDGGETDDGRPYVVMELVEGRPPESTAAVVDVRAAGGARPAAAAFAAFGAELAEAVEAAHRRGVIHRDLKPSNVLVDGSGVPRVLDFGLAKAAGLGGEGIASTAAGSFLGSLPWTSPEQADGRADRADVRSDVYGLGATLYHLLTGSPPAPTDLDLRATLRAVVEDPVAPPSRLLPACDRDLEAVLLRALEKDPERRYATAADFARDLRAVAAGEPIAARRETAWRALAGAARRRRRALFAALAAAALFAAVATVVAALWRSAAEESARARRALDFFLDALGAADTVREGADARVADALDAVSRDLDARLPGDDAERLRFRRRLAALFAAHGRFDRALAECDRAAALAAGLPAPTGSDEFRARSTTALGRALALRRVGRFAEGAAASAEIAAALTAALSSQDPLRLDALAERAQAERALGRLDAAAATLEEILRATERAAGPDDGLVARGFAHDVAAAVAEDRGRPDAALDHARRALEDFERCGAPHERHALVARSNLANLLRVLGRADEAVATLEPALPRLDRAYGADHPTTLAARHNLGAAYAAAGRAADAVATLRATYERRKALLGSDADRTLATLNELAVASAGALPPAETEALLRELVAARTRAGGAPLERLTATNNLAKWIRDRGRPAEAAELLAPAVAEALRLFGEEHVEAAVFRANYGRSLALAGRKADALPHLKAAAATLAARLGTEHPFARGSAQFLAECAADPVKPPTPP